MNGLTKSRFEVIEMSYGCNKNLDDEVKKRRPIIASATASPLLTTTSTNLTLNDKNLVVKKNQIENEKCRTNCSRKTEEAIQGL